MAVALACATVLFVSTGRPIQVEAGAYIFAGKSNLDIITHPIGYDGTGGEKVIRVGIDPGSPHAQNMAVPVQNIIAVYNSLTTTVGNLVSGGDNNIPVNAIDFESVALHEMGHALGLAHPNLASESELPLDKQNYTKSTDGPNNTFDIHPGPDGIIGSADDMRGDDDNLHWFNRDANDPFVLEDTLDTTTYSRRLADLPMGDSFAVNADRIVAEHMGYPNTEAVMQQLTHSDEAQRTLVADDVATLRLACAGIDETEGTSDDYTFRLVYAGLTTDADIVLGFDSSQTQFAVTFLSLEFTWASHIRVTDASIYFNTGINWFFNTVPADEKDVIYVESGAVCGANVPCYATIQEGLDDAAARGPGASVIIRVADDTYTGPLAFKAPGEIIFDGGWSADFSAKTENHITADPGSGAVVFSKGVTVVNGLVIHSF